MLNELPQLTEDELNTAADMAELTWETIFAMKRDHLCGVHKGPRVGPMMELRVVCLQICDMTLTAEMALRLAGCTLLEEFEMVVKCGAGSNFGNMSLTRLRMLTIRPV